MPFSFVDNFALNRLTLNICQTNPFLPSLCQLWLGRHPLNVFSFRMNQHTSWSVEGCKFGNLEGFVSEALFEPFFERYIILRYWNFVSWFQVWFSDQFTRLLSCSWNQDCYMLRRDLVRCQWCYAIDSRIDCANGRLQFVYVAIRPFMLQRFVDDVMTHRKLRSANADFALLFVV